MTEYEGDYDTDIASAVPHKDALKGHSKENSSDSNSINTSHGPPPLPPVAAPRVPPPLPSQPPPPPARASADMPRAAPPPPPPPAKEAASGGYDDDDYDPFRYNAAPPPIPAYNPPVEADRDADDDLYASSPRRSHPPPPPVPAASQERSSLPSSSQENAYPVPVPAPSRRESIPPPPARSVPRQSSDLHRSATSGKRSVDLSRMSMDSGYIANDIDLAASSKWWTLPNGMPPVFHNRKDILYEFDESTTTKRGGKTMVTKDLYVLFQDYSQTVVTAAFDAHNPSDVKLEQRHEQPPARLRQDQLEDTHARFGRPFLEAVTAKKESVVGDGTPQALVEELLKPFTDALHPVGNRAYGALVYANMANASTQQNDEIRPGDIISFRNAKFQGKHGAMHAKYSTEVGRPEHVAVVAEWDGTKKKVRAWEQGREGKKVKLESFKLDDLRSGEVKIWRIMPRSWVGWEGSN